MVYVGGGGGGGGGGEVVGSSRVVCFLFYFVFLNVSIISY